MGAAIHKFGSLQLPQSGCLFSLVQLLSLALVRGAARYKVCVHFFSRCFISSSDGDQAAQAGNLHLKSLYSQHTVPTKQRGGIATVLLLLVVW